MKLNLTKAVIATLPVGTHGDVKVVGLFCNVTATSRKFGVYISVRGRPVRKSIGSCADFSIEAARLEALRIISKLRSDTPAARVKAVTLGGVLNLYTEYLEGAGRRDSSYMDTVLNLYWSKFLDRTLDDVTVLELTTAHNRIVKERGPSAARYAVTCLRTLYNYAASLELTTANPAKRVRTAAAVSREVFLDEGEIKTLRACLAEMAPNPRHYFTLILLTGARRENMASMRWEEIDLEEALWTIPAEKSKNGLRMEIPLIPEAVEILQGRRSLDSWWVFPSATKAGQNVRCIDDWIIDLRRRMRERGVEKHFTVHDLRRTFACRLVAAGVPTPTVAKALGHRGLSSVAIYARVATGTVREALLRV